VIRAELSPQHRETIERLQVLSDELQHKVIGSALTAAARPLKNAMKSLSPTKTGKLRDSIGQSRISARAAGRLDLFENDESLEQAGTIGVLVGPNKKVGGRLRSRLANLLEFGTKAHRIKPKSARGILKLRGGLFARSVQHPGIKPTRYMAQALEQAGDQIEAQFFEGMAKRLDRLP